MTEHLRHISVGKAHVTIIHIGDIRLPLAEHMNVPESAQGSLSDQQFLPIQFTLVQHPEATVLVDAGVYDVEENPEFKIPGYAPPPSLVEQLDALGVQPDQIDHVVITHRHWDHFNGTTKPDGNSYIPVFQHATHYLGRTDWERMAELLEDEDSLESQTFGVLHREGILKLVEERLEIVPGIEIISAPGETRGHQIVRIHSGDQTLYSVGDLYHHEVEFLNPEWRVRWAHPELTLKSRSALLERVPSEEPLIVATHIPEIGRLTHSSSGGIQWEVAA